MTNPPPNPNTISHTLTTHRSLVTTLTSFLTVCTHHILYLRKIYPPVSFLSTRAYNYPVRQSRHPAVCTWINDAVSAITDQLEKNTVSKIALCIFECDANTVLERWVFDLHSFPSVAKRERDVPLQPAYDSSSASLVDPSHPSHPRSNDEDSERLAQPINLIDLEANFRATLARITTSSSRLHPLPSGPDAPECSFTLTIEVKTNADRPVGRVEALERAWVAAEPDQFSPSPSPPQSDAETEADYDGSPSEASRFRPGSKHNPQAKYKYKSRSQSKSVPKSKTHPIRRLAPTPLFRMELWCEESLPSKRPFLPPGIHSDAQSAAAAARAAKMSYGAGTERFDPGFNEDEFESDEEGVDDREDVDQQDMHGSASTQDGLAGKGQKTDGLGRFDFEHGFQGVKGAEDVNKKPAQGRGGAAEY